MVDKYKLTREKNVFIAKRNIVDYIWKSANLEGITVTYPDTQTIFDGGIVNGLTVDNIIAINNLKYAWEYVLNNTCKKYDLNLIFDIHKIALDKLVINECLGKLRITPVKIGGTKWTPSFPFHTKVEEELNLLLSQNKSMTEIAIEVMLKLMRMQLFVDGNKRVAMLFANKIMIDNGCGIISISQEYQSTFYEKLIRYYETDNMDDLKQWIYNKCIDGMNI